MTPLQFEARYAAQWDELAQALGELEGVTTRRNPFQPRFGDLRAPLDRARVAQLYRAGCEQLALARSREYPTALVERLEQLTSRAHQLIYRRVDPPRAALARLARLFLVGIPQAVRAQRTCMLAALLVFVLPLVGAGVAAALDPGFALMVQNAQQLSQYEQMYGEGASAFGRQRGADSDFQMFGYYIANNIGIAFRTFAGGLFFGIGALFVLLFNGVNIGAVAGYLAARGFGDNFFSFVVTHGAFELSAIVLAGGAGLALGASLIVPGRRPRRVALRETGQALVPVLYGMTAMLLVAAGVEAFWSSARWVPSMVKYGVGGACWVLVLAWLLLQGRPRRGAGDGSRDAR